MPKSSRAIMRSSTSAEPTTCTVGLPWTARLPDIYICASLHHLQCRATCMARISGQPDAAISVMLPPALIRQSRKLARALPVETSNDIFNTPSG